MTVHQEAQGQGLAGRVAAALGVHTASLCEVAPGRWDFSPPDTALTVRARVEAGWLRLALPWGDEGVPLSPWALLRRQGRVAAPWRLTRTPASGATMAVGELPLHPGDDVEARVASLCAGVEGVLDPAPPVAPVAEVGAGVPSGNGALPAAELIEGLRGGGWRYREEEGDALLVDLPSRRGFFQATVAPEPGGGVRLAVALGRAGDLSEASREALGLLLLTVAGAVRLVRGSAVDGDGSTTVGLAVVGVAPWAVADLDPALAALTTAVDLCGPEVTALQEAELATRYLAARGWSSCSQTTPQTAPTR